MKFLRSFLILSSVFLLAMSGQAKLKTETVEYKEGDTVLEGYLAYDDAETGKRPGVLVVHEWTGLGDYAKKRAEQLAGLGYVAFAVDIYGKGVRPDNPKDAGAEASKYKNDRALLRRRMAAGLVELEKSPLVDPTRVAAIGYCFGGMAVLELARSGADLAGVVSFHGALDSPTPEDARNIKCKVLICHGADDRSVTPDRVAGFEDEMRKGGVDWEMDSYGGAVHGFTNPDHGNDPSKGVAYQEKADKRSWARMKAFFAEIFTK